MDSEPGSEDEEVEFQYLQTAGDILKSHGEGKVAFWKTRLHGKERKEMKERLRTCNTTVSEFVKELGREAEGRKALLTGNLSGVVTEKAAWHMVRELEGEGRMSGDSFYELVELRKKLAEEEKEEMEAGGEEPTGNHIHGFIQGLCLIPFSTLLFSERSIRQSKFIIKRSKSKNRCGVESILQIDASGGVCRKMGAEKEPFLYVILIRSSETRYNLASPVAYLLSERHDTEAVRAAISRFFSHIAKRVNGDWSWTPTQAVSDYSLPILRAESLALNGLPLYRYISWTWRVAVEGEVTRAEIEETTILRICGFHSLRNFPLTSGKTKDDRQLNYELRVMVGKLLMAETIQRLRGLLESLAVICWSEKYSEGVEEALRDFEGLSALTTDMMKEVTGMASEEENHALADSILNIAGAEPQSGSDWDVEDKGHEPPGKLHLSKYGEKPPFRDEEDEQERNVDWTGKTQRERSPWQRDLDAYMARGVARAEELDGAAKEKDRNPYHLTALVRYLRKDGIFHAPLLTCIMDQPLRYACDVPEKMKPVVTGLLTPVTNNACEGAFSKIKSMATERDLNAVQVLGRRKGKLRPAVLVRNLSQTHRLDFSSLSQDRKTGGQGPLHAIVPNRRKSKTKGREEDEDGDGDGEEGDDGEEGEEGDHVTSETAEVGDDAVLETWSKKSPSKSPKKDPKFLSPQKKLRLITPTKVGGEKRGRSRTKKSQARRKGNQSRKTTAVSSDEDAPEPGDKRKHSVSPVRKVRPLRSCAVRGLDGGAAAKAEADAAEAAAEAASYHGPIWRQLQERAGKGSGLTHPSPPLHVPVSPSPTPPPAPSSKPMTVDTASDTVAMDTASDSADNDIILASPVKPRSKAKTRARSPSPEGIPDPARWDLLQYVQSKVFPTIPKCFHGYIPPAPSRVFVSGLSSARNDAPARLETKTAGQPARSRKPGAATDRGWDGRFPAPDRHRKTHLLPQSWGLTKPGPWDGIRFHAVDTCTIDGEVMLLERYERVSGGAVSTFLKDIGRKSLAAALKLITMPGDSHWIGTDDFRREVVSLMGVKESTSEGESRYSLWGDHRYVFLRIFGETAGLTYTVSCDCHATYKRVPTLELMASIHAQSSLSDQLLALLNIDCMFWRSCATCGGKLKKLDIFPSHHLNFLLPVEIHGGTITCASDVGKGEEWSWLRTLRELPRSVTIPGARNASESEGDFVLEALVIYSNRNHFQMILTDVDGNFAFIYDGMRRPKIRPFNASELLASLAEGLDEKQEPTVSPTTAYYLRALEKPREGMGIVPSASIGSTATASSRRHHLPRKFRDQAEDY